MVYEEEDFIGAPNNSYVIKPPDEDDDETDFMYLSDADTNILDDTIYLMTDEDDFEEVHDDTSIMSYVSDALEEVNYYFTDDDDDDDDDEEDDYDDIDGGSNFEEDGDFDASDCDTDTDDDAGLIMYNFINSLAANSSNKTTEPSPQTDQLDQDTVNND